jgi:ribosomal 50S subunit-recycling heat shock protein
MSPPPPEGSASTGAGVLLQKVLAAAGIASRRASEELIAAGRVTVNGRVAELGSRVDPSRDVVQVDGVGVPVAADLVYLAVNKTWSSHMASGCTTWGGSTWTARVCFSSPTTEPCRIA